MYVLQLNNSEILNATDLFTGSKPSKFLYVYQLVVIIVKYLI